MESKHDLSQRPLPHKAQQDSVAAGDWWPGTSPGVQLAPLAVPKPGRLDTSAYARGLAIPVILH